MMITKHRLILLIVMFFIEKTLQAQNADAILKQYMEATKTVKTIQSDINYAMYKNEEGTKTYESYDGIQIRKQDIFYQQLNTMEYIQGKDFVVKLNTDQKMMMVGYSSKPILQGIDQMTTDQILNYFSERKLKDQQIHWEIELGSKEPMLSEISKIILHIDKKTYILSKQIIVFDMITDFAIYESKPDPDMGIPRLEITYSNYVKEIKNPEVLEQDRYFTHKNNTITAAPEFKNFDLIMAN